MHVLRPVIFSIGENRVALSRSTDKPALFKAQLS